MKSETLEIRKNKMKTQFPGIYYDPSLDKYEGQKVSSEKMTSITESIKKPGFPGLISSQK